MKNLPERDSTVSGLKPTCLNTDMPFNLWLLLPRLYHCTAWVILALQMLLILSCLVSLMRKVSSLRQILLNKVSVPAYLAVLMLSTELRLGLPQIKRAFVWQAGRRSSPYTSTVGGLGSASAQPTWPHAGHFIDLYALHFLIGQANLQYALWDIAFVEVLVPMTYDPSISAHAHMTMLVAHMIVAGMSAQALSAQIVRCLA